MPNSLKKIKQESIKTWLIHVDAWQKSTQHCKAIILQLKIYNFFKRKER